MTTTIMTKTNKGFTLIELLVVIAIIGVLAAVVLLAINPAELLRKSRDSTRFSDLATMRKAIDATLASQSVSWGYNNATPPTTTGVDCTTGTACTANANGRESTGIGYIPLNISSNIATLPIDPRNNTATSVTNGTATGRGSATAAYYFRWDSATETYTLGTYLESSDNYTKAAQDGGNLTHAYETGTAFLLTATNMPVPT